MVATTTFQGFWVTDRLDRSLRALKDEPTDLRLGALEAAVWRRLEHRGELPKVGSMIFAVRATAVVGFLCLGFAAGGLSVASASTRPNEISVFSVGPELAPSTLLEGQG